MRVLVACGGTGGHIFPALSFLETLKSKQKDLDVIIAVTKRKIESQILPKEYKIVYLSLYPLRLDFDNKGAYLTSNKIKRLLAVSFDLKNIVAVIKLLIATLQSIYIILRFQPDIVIGFGGYATFSLVSFAKLLGIKTIIHEQNVVPGVANRLLARFAHKIAISFDQTQEYFKAYSKKTIFTGNPRCCNLFKVKKNEALDFFGFSKDKFTILVMGGSQGSGKINKVFFKTLSEIPDKKNFQVIHLSGMNDFYGLQDSYKKMDISFKLFEFFRPMHYAYSAADLVVTRAGATTIGEIIFFGLPAIIIPYPFAYQHQIANAKILVERQAAILIDDNALDAITLKDAIMDLFKNRNRINNMRSKYEGMLPISLQQELSDAVLSLAK